MVKKSIVIFVFTLLVGIVWAVTSGKQPWVPNVLVLNKYDSTLPADSDSTSTNGRVPLGTNGKGDDKHATAPCVIWDAGVYKMWYTGNDGSVERIYYATSPDGLTWTKRNNNVPGTHDTGGAGPGDGRVGLGTGAAGDHHNVGYAWVIKDGSTYKMWYSGDDATGTIVPTSYRIYYATSSDGLSWTKYQNAVPISSDTTSSSGRVARGTSGKLDQEWAWAPCVIKTGDSSYTMWYTGYHAYEQHHVARATSTDGLTWTKTDNSLPARNDTAGTNGRIPRGTTTSKDDYWGVSRPSVVLDHRDNTFRMWYTGSDFLAGLFYAYSSDGLSWVKQNNVAASNSNTTSTDGRIPRGTTSSFGDYASLRFGCVLIEIDKYSIWYSGGPDNATDKIRIYYAHTLGTY